MSSKIALALVLIFGFMAVQTTDAVAGTCRKDTREIVLSKNNIIRLRDYHCRNDRDPQSELRIQFQRLSGLAAGALLNAGSAPWHAALYGRHRVMSNDTLKEYKNLLTRFGSAVRVKDAGGGEQIAINLRIDVPEQTAGDDAPAVNAGKGAEVRSFRLPDLPDIPLVDETVEILNTTNWPASLNMFYEVPGFTTADDAEKPALDGMTVWRYLTSADAKDYAKRVARYNQLLVHRDYGGLKPVPKAMQLLEYLTARGWPEKFLYSSASIAESMPCIALDFRTHQYASTVDIAVIENTAAKPLKIDQFLGRGGGGNHLRKIDGASAVLDASELQAEAVTLSPGERLIVPLRIVLDAETFGAPEEQEQLSQDRFRRLGESTAGTVFQTEVYSVLRGNNRAPDDMFRVRKVRESFKPSSRPERSDYAFGPEWSLAGLAIGGEKTLFEALAPNFLEITASNEVGSCPILYAWSGSEAIWLRHGKVIHKAQSKANQASETIEFDGAVRRFRIAEEELERATIVAVNLAIDLDDGRTIVLAPDNPMLAAGNAVELYAHDEIEIEFVWPDGLTERDIIRSRVTVTGYYDRYPALLLSRGLQ